MIRRRRGPRLRRRRVLRPGRGPQGASRPRRTRGPLTAALETRPGVDYGPPRGIGCGPLGGLVLLIALFFLDWYSWEPSGDIAPLEISSSLFAQVDPNQLQIPVPDV